MYIKEGIKLADVVGIPNTSLTKSELDRLTVIMDFLTQNLWSKQIENDESLTNQDRERIRIAGE